MSRRFHLQIICSEIAALDFFCLVCFTFNRKSGSFIHLLRSKVFKFSFSFSAKPDQAKPYCSSQYLFHGWNKKVGVFAYFSVVLFVFLCVISYRIRFHLSHLVDRIKDWCCGVYILHWFSSVCVFSHTRFRCILDFVPKKRPNRTKSKRPNWNKSMWWAHLMAECDVKSNKRADQIINHARKSSSNELIHSNA